MIKIVLIQLYIHANCTQNTHFYLSRNELDGRLKMDRKSCNNKYNQCNKIGEFMFRNT